MTMGILWTGMVAAALVCGAVNGRLTAVTAAALEGAGAAVELTLAMAGALCLWSGVLEVMARSGMADGLSRLLRPVLRRLLPRAGDDSETLAALSANVSANLLGEQDFASFCGNPRMKKSTVRMVDHIGIEQRRDRVIFTFHGTGFLQNMVRILVGTLLEVGRGYWEPEYVQEILLAKDRKRAGPTAPPEGLCLMKVDY